ncbi:zinc-dependent alcohol dehydrogenase [Acerihabitans arboris]|uniref:Alcohol dehydrogenase catalytic domain-containing protein n=1 Tax=Acerihabitans arboris TaxID=2691583 RepID=A0A845SE11_9GAMM|nr:alcohol dehydrogenase catalytic domain-containing protein [Acerihabitans arboris]NDL61642.1 alcohol dehydrogenase catalytic domain-containing protein [Acerihabitans arboris]
MKAVRLYGIGDIRTEEIPLPRPGPLEVRLKVLAAGICGSDVHNLRTGQWISRSPATPGHEFCAEVLECGDHVNDFVPGDRVVADSRVWCGRCPACERGHVNLCDQLGFVGEVCDGGFAEQAVLPSRSLIKVPAELPAAIAALSEPLGVALRAVNQLSPGPSATVRVTGGGTIGGLAALLLHAVHGCRVQLIEPNARRHDLIARIVPLAGPGEFSLAIEATGVASVLNSLVNSITPGGRIASVGIFHGDVTLNVNRLVERELTMVGCSVFRDEQRQAIGLLPGLMASLMTISSPPIGLDEVPAAFAALLAGHSPFLKMLIVP